MGFLSSAVYDSRLNLMKALMDEYRLDALGLLTPEYFQWATNYFLDVRPWERPVAVIVPRNGDPFAVMHELSTNHLQMARERGTLWVSDISLYSEHIRLTDRLFLTHQWPELMASRLRERGLARAHIGLDAGGGPMAMVPAQLPELHLVPMERTLRSLRWVKHPEELDLLRQGGRLSDWGQERFPEEVRPGRLMGEIDLVVAARLVQEAAGRFPGQQVEIMCKSLSGPSSAAPHGSGAETGATVATGHVMVICVFIRVNGLMVENERTWFCGKPDEQQRKAFQAARDAQEAAIAELVPGRPVSAFDAAAQSVLQRAGYGQCVIHRSGHGIGLAGHEFPDDTAFNQRPLLEHEVFSAEPGIYIYGVGGFRHDDTVIVADPPEPVTRRPKDIASQTM